MAVPDPSDSSIPVWRRGEAAIPWAQEDTTVVESPAAAAAAHAAQTDSPGPQQLPLDQQGPLVGSANTENQVQEPDSGDNGADADADAERAPRQLHPLPRGLVELYGLLAVLFVLVPEWMASGALFGFREGRRGSELPAPSGAWKRLPELRLASLNLAELRQLAREQRLIGYGRLSRTQLTGLLLRRLKARP